MPIITLADISPLMLTAGLPPTDLSSILRIFEARRCLAALKAHPALLEPAARLYLDRLPFWD
jgi:hypothetical protein